MSRFAPHFRKEPFSLIAEDPSRQEHRPRFFRPSAAIDTGIAVPFQAAAVARIIDSIVRARDQGIKRRV